MNSPLISSRFTNLELIGQGTAAFVYAARDVVLDRKVAIKSIKNLEDCDHRNALEKETHVLSQLNHPAVVRLMDVERSEQDLALVLSFFPDGNLEHYLAKKTLSAGDVFLLLRTALAGLHYIHMRGWIHGDVKPGNLLVESTRKVAWCDLGCAVRVSDASASEGLIGSVGYMAPEILSQTGKISIQSDIFSLGVTIHELLTRSPAKGVTSLAKSTRFEGLSPLRESEIANASDWNSVLEKATQPNPLDRYTSVADLWADIARIQNHRPVLARKSTVWQRIRKWRRREPLLSRLLIVAALVLVFHFIAIGFARSYFQNATLQASQNQAQLDSEKNASVTVQQQLRQVTEQTQKQIATSENEEAKAKKSSDELASIQQTLSSRIEETTTLLAENEQLTADRNAQYYQLINKRRDANQAFLDTVPQVAIELVERQDAVDKTHVVQQRWLSCVKAKSDNGTKYTAVILGNGDNAFRIELMEPELVHGMDQLDDAASSIWLVTDVPVSVRDLGKQWRTKRTAKHNPDSYAMLRERIQLGNVYELKREKVARIVEFRIRSLNNRTYIDPPESVQKSLVDSGIGLDNVSFAETAEGSIEVSVWGVSVPVDVLPILHSVAKKVTYDSVRFQGTPKSQTTASVIEELCFSKCTFAVPLDAAQLFSLGPAPALQRLEIVDCEGVPESLLMSPESFPSLSDIRYFRTSLSEGLAKNFGALPSLASLAMVDAKLDQSKIEALARSGSLIKLLLKKEPLTADIYRPLAKMPSLLELSLMQIPLHQREVSSIGELRNLASLEIVPGVVEEGKFRDEHIMEISKLSQLSRLKLVGNQLTDRSLKEFAKCKHLIELDIASTQASDALISTLIQMPKLSELNITATQVSAEGIAHFKKSRPKVSVQHSSNPPKSNTVVAKEQPPIAFRGYQFQSTGKAKATISYHENDAVIAVSDSGDNVRDVQFYSGELNLIEGQRYRARIEAASPSSHLLSFRATQNSGEYNSVGLNEQIQLAPEFKVFEFFFIAKDFQKRRQRIGLEMGTDTGEIRVRNILLTLEPSPDEVIESIHFQKGGGRFYHLSSPSDQWVEANTGNWHGFVFREMSRDANTIVLHDAIRRYSVRLPIDGGEGTISIDNEKTWVKFNKTERLTKSTERASGASP